jgi:hypothetical protein
VERGLHVVNFSKPGTYDERTMERTRSLHTTRHLALEEVGRRDRATGCAARSVEFFVLICERSLFVLV